jgi:hypothetical protein
MIPSLIAMALTRCPSADWCAWASARSMARSFQASAPGRLTSTMSCYDSALY